MSESSHAFSNSRVHLSHPEFGKTALLTSQFPPFENYMSSSARSKSWPTDSTLPPPKPLFNHKDSVSQASLKYTYTLPFSSNPRCVPPPSTVGGRLSPGSSYFSVVQLPSLPPTPESPTNTTGRASRDVDSISTLFNPATGHGRKNLLTSQFPPFPTSHFYPLLNKEYQRKQQALKVNTFSNSSDSISTPTLTSHPSIVTEREFTSQDVSVSAPSPLPSNNLLPKEYPSTVHTNHRASSVFIRPPFSPTPGNTFPSINNTYRNERITSKFPEFEPTRRHRSQLLNES